MPARQTSPTPQDEGRSAALQAGPAVEPPADTSGSERHTAPVEAPADADPIETPKLAPRPDDPETWLEASDDPGVVGGPTDPTPDEHYTIAGVLAGKPTPENDEATRRSVLHL